MYHSSFKNPVYDVRATLEWTLHKVQWHQDRFRIYHGCRRPSIQQLKMKIWILLQFQMVHKSSYWFLELTIESMWLEIPSY